MRRRSILGSLMALALVVSACSSASTGASNGSASSAGAASSEITVPQLPAAGGGSCSVKITGDMSKSWKSNQTQGSLLVSYWLSASEAAVLSLNKDQAYFIMNCVGGNNEGTVSFTLSNDTTTAQFPEGPGTYVIPNKGGLAGVSGGPGQVGMIMSLHDNAIWSPTDPGTFRITTFGGGKFAGTFEVKIGKLGEDLHTITATALLSGTFDLGCTSAGCS